LTHEHILIHGYLAEFLNTTVAQWFHLLDSFLPFNVTISNRILNDDDIRQSWAQHPLSFIVPINLAMLISIFKMSAIHNNAYFYFNMVTALKIQLKEKMLKERIFFYFLNLNTFNVFSFWDMCFKIIHGH
jgi:hypothetical protein